MNNESFNSIKHLSYDDLVEYNQGNLSNSEMHRIELHLISCELCKEALEGLGTLNKYDDVRPSILKIKKSIGSDEAGGSLSLYHYLGIAASIILIAVLGFVFTRTSDEAVLVANETTSSPTSDGAIKPEAEPKVTNFEEEEAKDSLIMAAVEVDETATPNNQTDYEIIAKEEVSPVIAQETTEVVDSPIPDPLEGQADLVSNDSTAFEISQDTSLIASEMAIDESNDMARSQKKVSAAPSETMQGAELEEVVSIADQAYVQAKPEKGSRAYQRYLRKNLNYPAEARNNNIEGDVELSVAINLDGSIGEITITKSLGFGCDKEAIRLVREGQNWIPGTRGSQPINDTVTVIVSFKP